MTQHVQDPLAIHTSRLKQAIELSRQCIPVPDAFSVGALVYGADGTLLTTGYSREVGARSHAEEVAIKRARQKGLDMKGGIIYTSMEPCGKRSSSNKTCTELIAESQIHLVVFALREPTLFVNPRSLDRFDALGITLIHIEELSDQAREVNMHVLS